MRRPFTVAFGILLLSSSPIMAQGQRNTETGDSLRAARAELHSLKKELQALQNGSGAPAHKKDCSKDNCKKVDTCGCCPAAVATRQFIVRRYRWVPASSVGLNGSVISSGTVTLGNAAVSTPGAVVSQPPVVNSPVYSTGVLNPGVVTGSFVTPGYSAGLFNGYATGFYGTRSFSPANSSVLPASPNVVHSSYGVYHNGTYSQSLGASGYGTGYLDSGIANTPVYPTTIFRRTSGYINAVPAPHYSVY